MKGSPMTSQRPGGWLWRPSEPPIGDDVPTAVGKYRLVPGWSFVPNVGLSVNQAEFFRKRAVRLQSAPLAHPCRVPCGVRQRLGYKPQGETRCNIRGIMR